MLGAALRTIAAEDLLGAVTGADENGELVLTGLA